MHRLQAYNVISGIKATGKFSDLPLSQPDVSPHFLPFLDLYSSVQLSFLPTAVW